MTGLWGPAHNHQTEDERTIKHLHRPEEKLQ